MNKLQTILGSLALAGTVAVPVSQSNAETLDSLIDSNTSHIELMQANAEKSVAQQIFDSYKNKLFVVKVYSSSGDSNRYVERILEFPDDLTKKVKLHDPEEALSFTTKGRTNTLGLNDGLKGALRDGGTDSSLFIEFWKYKNFESDTANSYIRVGIDPKTKQHVFNVVSIEDGKGSLKNNQIVFEEFDQKVYEIIDGFKKGIIGKYKVKNLFEIKNNIKYEMKLDDVASFELKNEKETNFLKIDSKNQVKEHKFFVDFKVHNPLELEFTDKGEMIYNSGESKTPYKTSYDFDLYRRQFYYQEFSETVRVVPKSSTQLFDEFMSTVSFRYAMMPIFEQGKSIIELEVYQTIVDEAKKESHQRLFILEKVK